MQRCVFHIRAHAICCTLHRVDVRTPLCRDCGDKLSASCAADHYYAITKRSRRRGRRWRWTNNGTITVARGVHGGRPPCSGLSVTDGVGRCLLQDRLSGRCSWRHGQPAVCAVEEGLQRGRTPVDAAQRLSPSQVRVRATPSGVYSTRALSLRYTAACSKLTFSTNLFHHS